MTDKNKTEIIVVLDRSGSMASIKSDMQGGFTVFVEEQRKIPGECLVTLAQFDNDYEIVYEAKPLAEVPHLELHPRGGTALLDAIGRSIDAVGLRLSRTPEAQRPGKVLFAIITDGHENASRQYSHGRIREMIEIQRSKFSWEFLFMGASEDALDVAKSYGISVQCAVAVSARAGADAQGVLRGVSKHFADARTGKPLKSMGEYYAQSVAEAKEESERK